MEGTGEIFVKRIYNTYPFLIKQKETYNSHLNEDFDVYVNVVQNDNLFGDRYVLNLAGLDIEFRLYDIEKNLVFRKIAEVSNVETSEVKVEIDSKFITKTGDYYGYFTFIDLDFKKFILPLPNDKTRIKIKYS